MAVREFLHKARRPNCRTIFGLLALSVTLVACTAADAVPAAERQPGAAEPSGPASVAESSDARSAPPAGHAWVIFGADTVVAEVAATADERAEGLMYRDEVPDGTGMLFVFQDSQPRAFWMANTYVPLDIAYMDPSYRIVDIIQMEPLVTDSYPSGAPSMFALEVRQGWFAEHEIRVGAVADIEFGVRGR